MCKKCCHILAVRAAWQPAHRAEVLAYIHLGGARGDFRWRRPAASWWPDAGLGGRGSRADPASPPRAGRQPSRLDSPRLRFVAPEAYYELAPEVDSPSDGAKSGGRSRSEEECFGVGHSHLCLDTARGEHRLRLAWARDGVLGHTERVPREASHRVCTRSSRRRCWRSRLRVESNGTWCLPTVALTSGTRTGGRKSVESLARSSTRAVRASTRMPAQ